MPTPPVSITKRELEKLINCVKRNNGNRSAAAKELGMGISKLKTRLAIAEDRGMEIPPPIESKDVKRPHIVPDDELKELWAIYERYGYNVSATAEAIGMPTDTLRGRIKMAQFRLGISKRSLGQTHAAAAKPLDGPKKGEIKRYILTAAQNNTVVHEATWESLINLANFWDAEIKVSTFTYVGKDGGSEKRGTEKKDTMGWRIKDRWYDVRLEPYISDDFEQLAPGLVWCGHSNILPTSADPLRGKQSLNGRASGIFPHTRMEMRPIATIQGEATKFNWSTGAVTLRNYIQQNAGIMAEFYHCYGGLLVEVDDGGNWWVRQLNADSDGTIYDFDIFATPEGVFEREGCIPALVTGDIHWPPCPKVHKATWGEGGLVDVLRPKRNVVHDLLNFNPSHHSRKDPHVMYALRRRNEDVIYDEIDGGGQWLDSIHRTYPDGEESEEIVVDSNHHRHLDRYLKEVDWRQDLTNAKTILEMNLAWLEAIDAGEEEEFLAYEWALKKFGHGKHAHFMNVNSAKIEKLSLVVCPANGGGVEVGALHGHQGANGAHGTPQGLSKLGRKNVIADKHAPGIWGGTYVAGMSGPLRMGYNNGPGGWAPAHVPVYPNGKRQVLLGWVVNGEMKFRA